MTWQRNIQWTVPTLGLLLATACTPTGDAGSRSTAAALDSASVQRTAELQAERDSLLASAQSLFEAMNAIDSAASLAGYKGQKAGSEPLGNYQQQVRDRTVKALERLRTVEARLKASVARAERLGGENQNLTQELESFRQTATALQVQIGNQTARIDTLVYQLALEKNRGDSLQYRTVQLGYTIDSLGYEDRKVFVVAGDKNFLVNNQLAREEGGTRFPFIVKMGETLRPTGTPPDKEVFTQYDKDSQTVIPLDSGKEYEVVSVQNLAGADLTNARGRVFRGSIQIVDPNKFWAPSRYLILREK